MKKSITKVTFSVVVLMFLYSCGTMMGTVASPEMRQMEKIIEAEGNTMEELYVKTNSWFVRTFNSAESVIEYQDKEVGKIMGKYTFSYTEGIYTYRVRQTLSVDLKDNRARIVIDDPYFMVTGDALNGSYVGGDYRVLETEKGLDRTRQEWESLIASLGQNLSIKDTEW